MRSRSSPSATKEATTLEIQAQARIHELERALAHVSGERDSQAAVVQEELNRLANIYDRLRSDLNSVRAQRDQARQDAQSERERRARETLELAEQLAALKQAGITGHEKIDRFVAEKMAAAPLERRELGEGELPTLPGFETEGFLGQGGMANVFRARRLSDNLLVAVKLLRSGAKSPDTRTELFLREAAVMLQLEHPGLVRALDAGDSVYGRYLVLELIEGASLASRVRRDGPVQEREAVEIALQVSEALAFCAKLGLTHRDVKPSNLLQAPDGQVKLCDFGLTALNRGDEGRPFGSPGYAAPEQLSTPRDVDERADVYGLGCSLWHLVVGRRPFPGATKEAFAAQRITDLNDPRFEGADISPRLARVIRRMGRVSVSRRYRNWAECIMDLMLVQKGNPPFAAHLADALEPSDSDGHEIDDESGSDFGESGSDDRSGTGEWESASAPEASAPAAESVAVRAVAAEPPHVPPPTPLPGTNASARLALSAISGRPSRRGRLFVLAAAAVLAAAVGALFNAATRPGPVDLLEDSARRLAAEGRIDEAAAHLREAARLLNPADAAHLLAVAEELQTSK